MRVSRGGWALTALSLVVVVVLLPDAAGLLADVTGPSFPDAIVAAASLAALALAAWSLGVIGLVLGGGSSRFVRAVTPAVLRRAVLVGAAGALAAGPVHADQASSPSTGARHSVAGLPLPDRPESAASSASPGRTDPASEAVRVRPGDTLWAIAARSLGPTASDVEIARATAQWHLANRDVIGDDPDLIFPTQRLVPPIGKDRS